MTDREDKEFYELGKKMFDRLNPQIAHNPKVVEPVQEPVAWMVYTQDGQSVYVTDNPIDIQEGQRALPLYSTPPQRPWVGLTDNEADEVYRAAQEQINEYWESGGSTIMFPTMLYKAIETKLKEKNT
jgi:hypothetical protein